MKIDNSAGSQLLDRENSKSMPLIMNINLPVHLYWYPICSCKVYTPTLSEVLVKKLASQSCYHTEMLLSIF